MVLLMKRAARPLHFVFIILIFIKNALENVEAFSSYQKVRRPCMRKHSKHSPRVLRQSRNNENDRIQTFREEQTRLSLIESIMEMPSGKSLLTTLIVGQAQLATSRNRTRTCAVLASEAEDASTKTPTPTPCLFLPLDNPDQLKLLSFAISNKPIRKTVLLGLNTLLVNRDDALFDNLPWSTWTLDPAQRNRDAAGNALNKLFHFGKRDAYNRFMGKDWHGENLAMGNLALRLESSIAAAFAETDDPSSGNPQQPGDEAASLAKRILELQIRELEMDSAECDYQLAVSRTNSPDQVEILQSTKEACLNQLEISQRRLQELEEIPASTRNSATWIASVLAGFVTRKADSETNSAPYRGTTGYTPMLESRDDPDKNKVSYTSPYDFMREVIEDQLNAQVIGALLENSSLLDGTLALGGALILRRLVATKSVTIAGENLQISDDEEDFGNEGILGGETLLVECNADEAIGMSIACSVHLRIESDVWKRASLMAEPQSVAMPTEGSPSIAEALPIWIPLDPELCVLSEGQAGNQSTTERVSPLRVPRSTTSLFDTILDPSNNDQSRSSTMFPTENLIQSLSEYDVLSNDDKARTLMSMSNFEGKLPRPRVLRTIDNSDKSNPLDDLLLPLVDESVRRQYRIRDAELRGDTELVRELQNEKSRRQVAKEKAEQAREMGVDDAAERWDQEADIFSDLRADVTQDEGSYSSFLDRDDWYERDRQSHAKKLDKKKFGTLLDGLE